MQCSRLAVALSTVVGLGGVAFGGPPTFTGNVPADFGDAGVLPLTIAVPDFAGVGDVGIPNNFPPGTISGWDLEDLRFYYDLENDVMYVGMNFAGIAGDADGDGDPGHTSAALGQNGGIDFPDFGDSESFFVSFDTNRDGLADVLVGVSALVDITGFTAAVALPGPPTPFSFGAPLPANTGVVFGNTSAQAPDIEFTIPNFSQLPGFTEGLNRFDQAVMFNAGAFAGSLADDGFGEDNINNNLVTFGKIGFDGEPQGTLVTDQFLSEGMMISASSVCGFPGAYINNPFDNPTTDDIIPTSGDQVLTTKCDPNDDTSDAGEYLFNFVNPVDMITPGQAVFVSLSFLDIEDSGTPGRGTSHATFFDVAGNVIEDEPIPSGPNAGHFEATFSIGQGLLALAPCNNFMGTVGDGGDSGAVDTLCYNLAPSSLNFTVTITGGASAVHEGDDMELPIVIRNDSNTHSDALVEVTCGFAPFGSGQTLVADRHIRLRPRFTNEAAPRMFHLPVPTNLNTRWVGRSLRMRVIFREPHSRVILAQCIHDFTITQ
jgi:hypothetical protein